ncbi:MAG TPA: hypothetical protein PKE49_15595, partial [Leptospiraceae bacterium]|nr:hypothetical protein [Leptospiraceae bacterium]
TSFTDHVQKARSEKDEEFSAMFEGMDLKIQSRTRRVLETRKKQAAADPTEKKQEVKDLMDLSFLYLFKGDSDKALQLLFQAKKLGEETQGGEKPAS